MDFLKAILLGILQGVTEFLPISSSGHLVIFEHLFKFQRPGSVIFEVILHFATLLAVMVYYRERIGKVLDYFSADFLKVFRSNGLKQALWLNEDGRLISLIIIATVPTGLMGLIFEDFFVSLFNMPRIVGLTLCLTGIFLVATLLRKQQMVDISGMGAGIAMLIGVAQGLAIAPGISRSGATIAVGILLGMRSKEAADFSFLMSIPAILLAMALSVNDLTGLRDIGWRAAGAGFIFSFLIGYLALSFLISIVRRGRFHYFAFYCFALGLFALIHFS